MMPGGTIDEDVTIDTTWDLSGSPYLIGSDVHVMKGVTLTILHGTEVRFSNGASLVVEGALFAGDEAGTTIFGLRSGAIVWDGIRFEGTTKGVLERVSMTGAAISIDLNSSGPIWVRNSTLSSNIVPLSLRNSSMACISNSTLSWSSLKFDGTGSQVRTFSLIEGLAVDYKGVPRGNLRIEVFDRYDELMLSYLVNQTGEVPPFLLEGFSIGPTGPDRNPGTYLLSMSDDPFTHFVNTTLENNGTSATSKVWRFSWPPALTKVPGTVKVVEDHPTYYQTQVLDRNNAGSVDLSVSSPNVTYDVYNQELRFDYRDEKVRNETVILTLDDGYDTTTYPFEVNVTFWPDRPTLNIENRFVHVTENVPAFVILALADEDTSVVDLIVTTDDPSNITYLSSNTSLRAVFPDGAPQQFEVNVTVSDGSLEVVKGLIFIFTAVPYPPFFSDLPPELTLKEDEQLLFDLSQFIDDPDYGDQAYLRADSMDPSLFSSGVLSEQLVPGTGDFTLLISPEKNAFGTGQLRMVISDKDGLNSTAYLTVRIVPVNDAPILESPRVELVVEGYYRFLVTYYDVDGDTPIDLFATIDGDLLPMVGLNVNDTDVSDGKVYIAEKELGAGNHSFSFIGSDGNITKTLDGGNFITPEVIGYDDLEGYNGRLLLHIGSIGKGPAPILTVGTSLEGIVDGAVPIGCSFRIDPNGRTIRTLVITVDIAGFRDDILAQTARLYRSEGGVLVEWSVPFFNKTSGLFTSTLDSRSLGTNLSVWAELDPDLDSDGDGMSNILDPFPEDPNEWNDTDSDGKGDNSDPDDDDDGFTDDLEIAAGTNPRSAASVPMDTDSDGTLDYLDMDDDDDGMPDVWELSYLLDPLDPSDAASDLDNDGLTNLDEYRGGTDPTISDREDDKGISTGIVVLVVSLALVLLIIAAFLMVRMNRRSTFELDEGQAETPDQDWEVQGELDRDDAVECPECKEFYPYWEEKCPFCSEVNPMNEEG